MLIQILIHCDWLNEASPIILICPFLCRQTTVDTKRGIIRKLQTRCTPRNQSHRAHKDVSAGRVLAVLVQVPNVISTQLLKSSDECRWERLFNLEWVMMVAPHHMIWVWASPRKHLHLMLMWCFPIGLRQVGSIVTSWLTLPRKGQSSPSNQDTEDIEPGRIWKQSIKVPQPSR